MRVGLGLQVRDVDVAVVVALHDDDIHAAHLRRGRIGAVRALRDQADLAMRLAARAVIGADREQARVLALRARVRLQADRVVAGALDQHLLELLDQLLVAGRTARPARYGWICANSGQVTGIISAVALSFIVHEPSGIIVRSSARSLSASERR